MTTRSNMQWTLPEQDDYAAITGSYISFQKQAEKVLQKECAVDYLCNIF
jgi:hypothetical protein